MMTSEPQFRPVLHVGEISDQPEIIELEPVVRAFIKGTIERERPWVRALKGSEEQRAFDEVHQGVRRARIDGVPVRVVEREEREGDWIVYWLELD